MKVIIPESLFRFTDNKTTLHISASNITELQQQLQQQYPAFAAAVFQQDQLSPYVKLLKDDQLLASEALPDLVIAEGDVLEFITAMSGG